MPKGYFVVNEHNRSYIANHVMRADVGEVVLIKEPTRSLEQNARLWALLTDVSKQVVWHGRKLEPESWKHMFSASLKKQDVVPGLDGGFVVLGQSTSGMTKTEFSNLMELIEAFAAEHGVIWSNQQQPANHHKENAIV